MERATLAFEFAVVGKNGGYLCEPVLLGSDGRARRKRFSSGDPMDAFVAELKEVVGCVRRNTPSDILDLRLAQDAIVLCHKQTESLRRRRSVKC